MAKSTLTANERTTVPAEIRLAIGAVSGTRLVWRYVTEGRLSVRDKNKTAALSSVGRSSAYSGEARVRSDQS